MGEEETKRSWKTTLAGVGALAAAVGGALVAVFDGDPATVVNVELLVASVMAALVGLGLIAAKDSDK